MEKAKKPSIITRHTYKPGGGREDIQEPSITQPGHTRTIGEILNRYKQTGQLPETGETPYLDVENINQISKYFQPGQLDLTDIHNLKNQVDEMQATVEKAVKKQEEKAKKAKAEKARKEERERIRKQIIEEQKKEDN